MARFFARVARLNLQPHKMPRTNAHETGVRTGVYADSLTAAY